MKRSIFTTVSVAALMFGAPAMAQTVDLSSADHASTVSQTGNANNADVTQRKENQTSTIEQTGNSHTATVTQGHNFGNTSSNNTAKITQGKRADGTTAPNGSAGTILQLTVTLLPQALALTIPMSLLIGLLVALGRLSADREFVVMMACSRTHGRMCSPVARSS